MLVIVNQIIVQCWNTCKITTTKIKSFICKTKEKKYLHIYIYMTIKIQVSKSSNNFFLIFKLPLIWSHDIQKHLAEIEGV